MLDEELRAAFARHEWLAPMPGLVAAGIAQRYRRRRRLRLAWRVGGAALVAAAVVAVPAVAVGLAGGGSAGLPVAASGTAAPATPTPSRPAGSAGSPLNLLLASYDGSTVDGVPAGLALVHVPAARDRAYVITLNLDAAVTVPGHGTGTLRSAYRTGGLGLISGTVAAEYGVPVDAGAKVSMAGLGRVVDALGGVRLCPATGCRQYTGADAADLLRHQPVAEALRLVAADLLPELTAAGPSRLDAALAAAGPAVVLDPGTHTVAQLVADLRTVRAAVPLGQPAGASDAYQLFRAVYTDDLAGYLAAHPG